MKNVTISLDEEMVRLARIAAAHKGQSLSRFVSDMLADHLAAAPRANRGFLDGPLWDLSEANGRMPTRNEIYAEREDELLRRHERAALREGPSFPGKADDGG